MYVYVTTPLALDTPHPAWLDARRPESRGARCAESNRRCLRLPLLLVVLLEGDHIVSELSVRTGALNLFCELRFSPTNMYGSYIGLIAKVTQSEMVPESPSLATALVRARIDHRYDQNSNGANSGVRTGAQSGCKRTKNRITLTIGSVWLIIMCRLEAPPPERRHDKKHVATIELVLRWTC